jgi:hypothetical protein
MTANRSGAAASFSACCPLSASGLCMGSGCRPTAAAARGVHPVSLPQGPGRPWAATH